MSTSTLPITDLPLHQEHAKLGAKFGAFGRWNVPLYYSSILEEHRAVRSHAGLFDISHMGQFLVTGPQTVSFLDHLVPRNVSKIVDGKAAYTFLLNESAGIIDDIILYRFSSEHFIVIVNADNVEKDFLWMNSRKISGVNFDNLSNQVGLLAIQGPESVRVLSRLFPKAGLERVPYYGFTESEGAFLARTGYTGEDGFEIMVPTVELNKIWKRLVEVERVQPVGFGARDTLRLEAAMPLYGHDMDETVNPFEAGLAWSMDLTKPAFVGREALLKIKTSPFTKQRVGLILNDRGIPRQGCEVYHRETRIGVVTSGSLAPTLQKNIGMALISPEYGKIGTSIKIAIRNQKVDATVVAMPFYKRSQA